MNNGNIYDFTESPEEVKDLYDPFKYGHLASMALMLELGANSVSELLIAQDDYIKWARRLTVLYVKKYKDGSVSVTPLGFFTSLNTAAEKVNERLRKVKFKSGSRTDASWDAESERITVNFETNSAQCSLLFITQLVDCPVVTEEELHNECVIIEGNSNGKED
jgi:hypothetical protein